MLIRLLVVAFVPFAAAFSDSYPLLTWSSDPSWKLEEADYVPARVFDRLLDTPQLCSHDAIFFVHYPGLHVADFYSLPDDSLLSSSLRLAPSSKLLGHVIQTQAHDVDELARNAAQRCGFKLDARIPGQSSRLDTSRGHAFSLRMAGIDGVGTVRKTKFEDQATTLANELAFLSASFPRHLVVLVGHASFNKRQSVQPGPSSKPTPQGGGILQRYQLLTPALLTSLLVAIGLFVPILLVGISALASIKSPLRSDFKAPSAEKKNQ